MGFERKGGGRDHEGPTFDSGHSTAPPSAEDLKRRAEADAADLERVMVAYEQAPTTFAVPQMYQARLRKEFPDRMAAADAKAAEHRQTVDAQAKAEQAVQQQQESRRVDRAAQFIANVNAGIAATVQSLVDTVATARRGGKVTIADTEAIMGAVARGFIAAITNGVQDDAVKRSMTLCCNSLSRGETVEALPGNFTRVAASLERMISEKAPKAQGELFASVPTADAIGSAIDGEGRKALYRATGEKPAALSMSDPPTATVKSGDDAPEQQRRVLLVAHPEAQHKGTRAAQDDGGRHQAHEASGVSRHADGTTPPVDWASQVVASVPSETVAADDPGHRYHVLSDNTVVATSEPSIIKPEVAKQVLQQTQPKTPAEELAPYSLTVDQFTDYCKHHTARGWNGSQAAGFIDQLLIPRAVAKIPEDVRRRVKRALFPPGDDTLVMEEIGDTAVIGTRQQNAERRADATAAMERETLGNMTGGVFGAVFGGVAQWLHPDDRAKIHAASGMGALVDNMVFAHGMKGEGPRLEPPTERAIYQHGAPTHETVDAHRAPVADTRAPTEAHAAPIAGEGHEAQSAKVDKERAAENAKARTAESALSREQRLKELSKDWVDHGGVANDNTTAEAEVALALEEQGEVAPPVRRPRPENNEKGDFIDGQSQVWDVKAQQSRDKLIERIKATNAAKGKPAPKGLGDRPIRGEFELKQALNAILDEFNRGERVMLDMRGLNDADGKLLRDAIADNAKDDPRWKEWIRVWP